MSGKRADYYNVSTYYICRSWRRKINSHTKVLIKTTSRNELLSNYSWQKFLNDIKVPGKQSFPRIHISEQETWELLTRSSRTAIRRRSVKWNCVWQFFHASKANNLSCKLSKCAGWWKTAIPPPRRFVSLFERSVWPLKITPFGCCSRQSFAKFHFSRTLRTFSLSCFNSPLNGWKHNFALLSSFMDLSHIIIALLRSNENIRMLF